MSARTLLDLPRELLSSILSYALESPRGCPFGTTIKHCLTCVTFRAIIYDLPIWSVDLVGGPRDGSFAPTVSGSEILRRILLTHSGRIRSLRLGSRDVRVRWSASKADLALVATHCASIVFLDLGSLDEDAQEVLLDLLSRCGSLRSLWVDPCIKAPRLEIRAHTPHCCRIWR
jgi:hypothetical protein